MFDVRFPVYLFDFLTYLIRTVLFFVYGEKRIANEPRARVISQGGASSCGARVLHNPSHSI